jgi:diacylglycerol kinase family enzyme
VILNAAAGRGDRTDTAGRVTELFATRGLAAEVTNVDDGVTVPDMARKAAGSGAAAVVAAGGDGTVQGVAAALAGGQVPLGVLPMGTLNHFAKDMGLPLKLEDAIEVIANGNVKVTDVGEVNGRVFINNSSIGAYPSIVELRDHYRKKGVGKWIAAAWASVVVLLRRPALGVRIESAEGVLVRRTPFVFIGNNEYHMSGLEAGSRGSLSGGHLAVYVAKVARPRTLIRMAWLVLRKGVEQTPELDFISVREARVTTKQRDLQVALDGEVVTLPSPLSFRILPGALRVLAP